jgi:hypothetical protein
MYTIQKYRNTETKYYTDTVSLMVISLWEFSIKIILRKGPRKLVSVNGEVQWKLQIEM